MRVEKPTLEELAGRLIVGLEGPWPTAEEWCWLRQWRPAGVILFSRNVQNFPQLQHLCTSLKDQVPGLQIMADHEGGPVSQLASAVGRPPVAYALGYLDDVDLTRRVHEQTGRRLRAAGLDWVLGPCADVLSEKRNPVIGARSFGENSNLVARHVEAAVKGLRSAGILCCLKHWPGHGGSVTDSHLETTVVKISARDEEPFRAGLLAGAEGVMPGHLRPEGESWPATLSASFIRSTRARFSPCEPLLMADDVSMGALREPMRRLGVRVSDEADGGMVEVGSLSVEWFEHLAAAGCDRFLIRMIPFGAFPVGDIAQNLPSREVVSRESEPGFSYPEFGSGEDSYHDARRRLIPDFGIWQGDSGSQELVYLDLARTDRWQVASDLGPMHWSCWDEMLSSCFSSVLRGFDLGLPAPEGEIVSRILVAHHRPMPSDWESSAWARSLKNRLAATGRCLLMGHPSLVAEFEQFLGPGWILSSLFDVSCDDLGPLLDPSRND